MDFAKRHFTDGYAIVYKRQGEDPTQKKIEKPAITPIPSNRDLQIESLVQRVKDNDDVKEIILALSSTMEGDTTNFYIHRQLAPLHVKVTMIARGISVGNDLEYTDEVTLGRSIVNRTLMD